MPDTTNDKPCLELLGQKFYYPHSKEAATTAVLSFFVVATAITVCFAVVYVWAKDAAYGHVERIFSQSSAGPAGSIRDTENHGRLGFWAPSPLTYQEIPVPVGYEWQKGVSPERVARFEGGFSRFATGWRRYDVFGHGTSGAKVGYWYELSTRKEFSVDAFFEFYRSEWNTSSSVYFECLKQEGGYKEFKR